MRGTQRELIMRTHALSLTVLLAQFLTTTTFETSLTPRSMNSATTTSHGFPETNNGLLTSVETSSEIPPPSQSAVESLVMGHKADVSLTITAGLERTSTNLQNLPQNLPNVATKKDHTTRGTVSPDNWKATTIQTTLFKTLTRGVSSLPELPSNTDDARSHKEPLTDVSQSSDVTQPSITSPMPTQSKETHTHPYNRKSTITSLLQDLTSDGFTRHNETPTAHNYTQVRSQQYTKEPMLFSTIDSQEAQNTRTIMVTTEKDSTTEGTSTVTPQIQDLTSERNGTPMADNDTQALLSDESSQYTKKPLLNNTMEVLEAYTSQTTGAIQVSTTITVTTQIQDLTSDGNDTSTADNATQAIFSDGSLQNTKEPFLNSTTKTISEVLTTESTSFRTTVTPLNQDLTSDGNGTSTADNSTQAIFSDGTLWYTKKPLLSSTTTETIKENITMTTESVSTTDSTPIWTTLTSLIQDITSDVAATVTSTGSTVNFTQVQTVNNESTEEPWDSGTTEGMTSEAGTELKTEATSLHHTTKETQTETDTAPETTHHLTTLWASTNTSENISISDTKWTLWPSCQNPDENSALESRRSSRFNCFITIWSLAMTASLFLGITIFLWVRLSAVKKRARRKGWGKKDVKGPGGTERKSLWAEHDSSAAERVEFWYANGNTLEADKKGEGNQKKGKVKKEKKTGKEEEECIQPRVTMQEISQFWYSNGQVRNNRLQSQSELGDL